MSFVFVLSKNLRCYLHSRQTMVRIVRHPLLSLLERDVSLMCTAWTFTTNCMYNQDWSRGESSNIRSAIRTKIELDFVSCLLLLPPALVLC